MASYCILHISLIGHLQSWNLRFWKPQITGWMNDFLAVLPFIYYYLKVSELFSYLIDTSKTFPVFLNEIMWLQTTANIILPLLIYQRYACNIYIYIYIYIYSLCAIMCGTNNVVTKYNKHNLWITVKLKSTVKKYWFVTAFSLMNK